MSARLSAPLALHALAPLSILIAGSCSGDLPSSTEPLAPSAIIIPCEYPECGEPPPPPAPVPSPYFAPAGDFLYVPHWTVTPDKCYADRDPTVSGYRDYDKDWLADDCEVELAKAFAPLLRFAEDPCPGGEPAWAAKYFHVPKVVRIAYLPAYYDDCGLPQLGFGGGHAGDTEMIMVEIRYDHTAARWMYNTMWLSAHEGTGISERSTWVPIGIAKFTKWNLGHPSVWVAWRKHANYESQEACEKTLIDVERCTWEGQPMLRFPVHAWRNLGSRHQYVVNCVYSSGRFAGNGVAECFWTGRLSWEFQNGMMVPTPIFGGWHPLNDLFGPQPAPYGNMLLTEFFEYRCGWSQTPDTRWYCSAFGLDYGPGPSPYVPPSTDPPPPPPPSGCDDQSVFICPLSVRTEGAVIE